MLVRRVLIAAPLLLCLLSGHVTAQANNTTDCDDLPLIGNGFLDSLIDCVRTKYVDNRYLNNVSLNTFNDIWQKNFQHVIDEIKNLGESVKKVANDYSALISLQSANIPITQKGFQLAALTTQLGAAGMALLNTVTSVANDIGLKFVDIPPLIIGTVLRNVNFAKDIGRYIPFQISAKIKVILDEVNRQIYEVQIRVLAVIEQIQILLYRISVIKASVEIPVTRTLVAVLTQIQVKLLSTFIVISSVRHQVRLITMQAYGILEYAIKKLRDFVSPLTYRFRNRMNRRIGTITAIRNVFKGIRNSIKSSIWNFLGMFNRKPPPAPVTDAPPSATTGANAASPTPANDANHTIARAAETTVLPTTAKAP